jgi:hypothetical protein
MNLGKTLNSPHKPVLGVQIIDKYRPKVDSGVTSKVLDSGVSSNYGSDRKAEKIIGDESKNFTNVTGGGQGFVSTVKWTRHNNTAESTRTPKKDSTFFSSTGDGFYKPKNMNPVGSLADLGLRSKIEVLAGTRHGLYTNLSMQRDPSKALAETDKIKPEFPEDPTSIFGSSGFRHTSWQKRLDYNTLYSTVPNMPTEGGPADNKPVSNYRTYKDSAIPGFVSIAAQEPISSNHSTEIGRVSTPIGGGNSSFGFAGGKYDSLLGCNSVASKEYDFNRKSRYSSKDFDQRTDIYKTQGRDSSKDPTPQYEYGRKPYGGPGPGYRSG